MKNKGKKAALRDRLERKLIPGLPKNEKLYVRELTSLERAIVEGKGLETLKKYQDKLVNDVDLEQGTVDILLNSARVAAYAIVDEEWNQVFDIDQEGIVECASTIGNSTLKWIEKTCRDLSGMTEEGANTIKKKRKKTTSKN